MIKKGTKKILSLLLVVVMIVSTMAIAVVNVSAKETVNYTIKSDLLFGKCFCFDEIYIKVVGEKGEQTFNGYFGSTKYVSETYTKYTFEGADVGKIKYIQVKTDSILSSWFFKSIEISTPSDTKKFYGGRWVEDDYVTFNTSDIVYSVKVKTGNVDYAGTDADVFFHAYNSNGKLIDKYNITKLSGYTNSFEKNSEETFYLYFPEKIKKIGFSIKTYGIFLIGCDWYLDNVEIKQLSGDGAGYSYTVEFDQWITDDTDYSNMLPSPIL